MYILHCIITSLTSRSPGRFGSIMSWLLNKWHLPLIRSFGRIYDWIPQRHRRLRICAGWKGFRSLRAIFFCFSFCFGSVSYCDILLFDLALVFRMSLLILSLCGGYSLTTLSVCLSVWSSICLPNCQPVSCLFVCLSSRLSFSASLPLSAYLSPPNKILDNNNINFQGEKKS